MLRYKIGFLAVVLFSGVGTASASAYADSPIDAIRRTNSQLNQLLRKSAQKGSQLQKRTKQRVHKTVQRFLDCTELARLSLQDHWKKRSKKERAEFVQILGDLIERNYVRQLRGNLDYKLEYRKQDVKGQRARVVTAVTVDKNGRQEEVVIEYKMRKKSGRWMVYDVVTDEVSVVDNYRAQFNRIIKRESYDKLVTKMRNKLKQLNGAG